MFNPAARGQQVTVITLGRAGEDNKSFRLNDIDSTISGFAIADYGIQDAVQSGTQTTRTREVVGQVRWGGRRRRASVRAFISTSAHFFIFLFFYFPSL